MRADVREHTMAAARAERDLNDTYIALVSGDVVRAELTDEPVTVRVIDNGDGTVTFVMTRVAA